jgi:hypothetical protein
MRAFSGLPACGVGDLEQSLQNLLPVKYLVRSVFGEVTDESTTEMFRRHLDPPARQSTAPAMGTCFHVEVVMPSGA